jgi:hypothetical protein
VIDQGTCYNHVIGLLGLTGQAPENKQTTEEQKPFHDSIKMQR